MNDESPACTEKGLVKFPVNGSLISCLAFEYRSKGQFFITLASFKCDTCESDNCSNVAQFRNSFFPNPNECISGANHCPPGTRCPAIAPKFVSIPDNGYAAEPPFQAPISTMDATDCGSPMYGTTPANQGQSPDIQFRAVSDDKSSDVISWDSIPPGVSGDDHFNAPSYTPSDVASTADWNDDRAPPSYRDSLVTLSKDVSAKEAFSNIMRLSDGFVVTTFFPNETLCDNLLPPPLEDDAITAHTTSGDEANVKRRRV